MGLFDQILKRSFHTNQPQFNGLVKEYEAMGFAKAHITKAWQRCKGIQERFHDELILVATEENSKLMSHDDLMSSTHKLKSNLQMKEEDLIKQAIQLSLQTDQIESSEDLKEAVRKDAVRAPGLRNLGNTCYMNVMLQSLYACVPFRNLVVQLNCPSSETAGQVMMKRLQELFSMMLEGNRSYVNPAAFFESMSKFKPSTLLVKGVQNDYYELWVSFLDAIEAGMKEVLTDPAHPIIESFKGMFYGRAEENLMYSDGDAEIIKASETTFGVVNLDSKDGELYKAFHKCQSLSIDEYLPDGGQQTEAKIDVKLLEIPKVLSFYINRVNYDPKAKKVVKNNSVFQFDEKIMLDQFYKNPEETTKHNKQVQERLEKLKKDEIECLEGLKQCGDCDADKSDSIFDGMIQMLSQSQDGLQRSISFDDFVVFDKNSGINSDMLAPSELISQLEKYKQVYAKRRNLFNEKLHLIQKEKQSLMQEKQNLYCLTGVIIHEGTADSGHYTCFTMDQKQQWVKCNDRTTQYVSFDEVYKTATGKLGQQRNVSGLVYQEQSWMSRAQSERLPASLEQHVQTENKSLFRLFDEQTFERNRGCVQSRMNFLKQRTDAVLRQKEKGEEIVKVLQVLKMSDTFMAQQNSSVYNYHLMKQALKIESDDIKAKLKLPENYEEYEKKFLSAEIPSYQQTLASYNELSLLYRNLQALVNPLAHHLQKTITLDTFELQLELIARTHSSLSTLCQTYPSQVYVQRLRDKLRALLGSLLLKGCFFADLLVQMQDGKVIPLMELIRRVNEEYNIHHQFIRCPLLSKLVKEQILSNLKATLERLKSTNSLLKQVPTQSVAPLEQSEPKDYIDSDVLAPKLQILLTGSLKTWMDFVIQIERNGKLISQDDRLRIEEPLYFLQE